MLNLEVKKRFVSDMKLSFPVLEDPYFDYYVELYNEHHKSKEKLDLLIKEIERFGSQDEFLKTYYEVRDTILTALKNEAYNDFISMDMNKYGVKNQSFPRGDVFKKSNVGKIFVSIDLVKANFQALKFINKDLVLGANTYNELVSKFTDMDYIKESKYIRQVIFGNLNPKRTITVERYLIEQVLNLLFDRKYMEANDVRMVSTDEIVYEINDNYDIESITNLMTVIKETLNIDVDIEIYKLKQIGNIHSFFLKEFLNKDGYEIMCVPQDLRPQVLKYLKGEVINDFDRTFKNEGRIAIYKDDLQFNEYKCGDKVIITNLIGLEETNLEVGDVGTYISKCKCQSRNNIHLIVFDKEIIENGSLEAKSQAFLNINNFKLNNGNIY